MGRPHASLAARKPNGEPRTGFLAARKPGSRQGSGGLSARKAWGRPTIAFLADIFAIRRRKSRIWHAFQVLGRRAGDLEREGAKYPTGGKELIPIHQRVLAAEGFGYRESGHHLMLMAFLQRVVNGGGRIEREYGLGRGALDLLVDFQGKRHAIEVKLRRDTQVEKRSLEQVARYLDTAGLDEGWLVMFELRAKLSWGKRIRLGVERVDVRRM